MNPLADRYPTGGCDCDSCQGGDLPATPFLGPRIRHGMLLGEDDFRALTGYPRGKHLLHQSWLHGAGVIWGYPVRVDGDYELQVGSGLAVDRIGRELIHAGCDHRDLRTELAAWVKAGSVPPPDLAGCRTYTVHACVLASFEGCLSDPVPTVADPCDVTRSHDDYSRVVEQTRILVRPVAAPDRFGDRYRRVRMLLGVAALDGSAAGRDVSAAQAAVRAADDPALELERQVWELAYQDGLENTPPTVDGAPSAFPADPVDPEDSAVVLAQLCLELVSQDGYWTFDAPDVRPTVRTTLLPADVLTALAAATALPAAAAADLGPRVEVARMRLVGGRAVVIPVTAPLVRGTVPGSVQMTLLAPDTGRWMPLEIDDATFATDTDGYVPRPAGPAIVARLVHSLDDYPLGALIRVRVRGTGARPVMGSDPLLPLAGTAGSVATTDSEVGQDAVWTFTNDPAGQASTGTEASQ